MHEPSTWSGPQHQPVPKPTHISHVVGDSGGDFQDHGRPAWDGVLWAAQSPPPALALGGRRFPFQHKREARGTLPTPASALRISSRRACPCDRRCVQSQPHSVCLPGLRTWPTVALGNCLCLPSLLLPPARGASWLPCGISESCVPSSGPRSVR